MRWPIITILLLSVGARASQIYRITGEVVGVTPHTVSIRHGTQVIEFARSKHLGFPKKGDRITITYHLDAEQISPAPQNGGSVPGLQEGPIPSNAPGSPGIIDDRAFYNAKK